MLMRILVVVSIVAGCGASSETSPPDEAPVEQSEDSSESVEPVEPTPGPEQFGADKALDPELEADFARRVRSPLLLTYEMPADGMKVVLNREIALMQRMSDRYTKQAEEHPQIRPLAVFRLAQLNTRLACSVAGAPPPNQLAKEQVEVYQSYLADHSYGLLGKNEGFLDYIPEGDALRPHLETLANVPAGAGMDGLITYCAKSEKYWHHRANELGVDEVEAGRCKQGDAVACWVWAKFGSGGKAAEDRACELGAMLACPPAEAEDEDL